MCAKKQKDFVKKQEYPGGTFAFKKMINENLIYPKVALENKIQGIVFLSYMVDLDGVVKNITVLKGIGFGCDEEAIRLVGLMKYAPQRNRGIKITNTFKIKIEFKIEESPVIQSAVNYSYEIIPKKLEDKDIKKSYSYTITK